MKLIDGIREKVHQGRFEFSRHAVDRMIQRQITVAEVRQAVEQGEVIEDYPRDKYGPSCLIYGDTVIGRALHIQCSYPQRALIKIITVYEPDPDEWNEFRERTT